MARRSFDHNTPSWSETCSAVWEGDNLLRGMTELKETMTPTVRDTSCSCDKKRDTATRHCALQSGPDNIAEHYFYVLLRICWSKHIIEMLFHISVEFYWHIVGWWTSSDYCCDRVCVSENFFARNSKSWMRLMSNTWPMPQRTTQHRLTWATRHLEQKTQDFHIKARNRDEDRPLIRAASKAKAKGKGK